MINRGAMSGRPLPDFTEAERARFSARVARADDGECWPYASGAPGVYGVFKARGLSWGAHRVAFKLAHGRDPIGVVRHACDNPPCCNPAHLLDGPQRENVRDMDARGRRGEKAPKRRPRGFHERIVEQYNEGVSQRRIAARFRVCRTWLRQYLATCPVVDAGSDMSAECPKNSPS